MVACGLVMSWDQSYLTYLVGVLRKAAAAGLLETVVWQV